MWNPERKTFPSYPPPWLGVGIVVLFFAAFLLIPLFLGDRSATAQVDSTPIARVLQAAVTADGPGSSMSTGARPDITVAVQISGTATVKVLCSVDNGLTYDLVQDSTLTQASGCGTPSWDGSQAGADRCVLSIHGSCTNILTPVSNCSGCVVTTKVYAQ